jgi:hypothetical protein
LLLSLLLLLLQVMSVVGILQDETDPMVSVMKVRDAGSGCARHRNMLNDLLCCVQHHFAAPLHSGWMLHSCV